MISLMMPVITTTSAYALAPVVALESKLDDDTGIIAPASNFPRDGMAPFVALDPNDNNGTVATMDITQHKFDVSVNTLNGASHNVTALTITALLTSATSEVRWMNKGTSTVNVGGSPTVWSACSTLSVSNDGKTATCVINGPIPTGTTLAVYGSWFAGTGAPNGTDATVSFTTTATYVPDATSTSNPVAAPAPTSSTTQILSNSQAAAEVRKRKNTPGINTDLGGTYVRDPSTGDITHLRVKFPLEVDLSAPNATSQKGWNSAALGDINLVDGLSSLGGVFAPIQSKGILQGCEDLQASNSNSIGFLTAVRSSGTWTCTQAGGPGTDININITDIDYSPEYFPGMGLNNPDYFAFNTIGLANDTFGSPVTANGSNTRLPLAIKAVVIDYPIADVMAIDNTAADLSANANSINFCNSIGSINVAGNNPAYSDLNANNNQCVLINAGNYGLGATKNFVALNNFNNAPGNQIGWGVGGSQLARDDYVGAGQTFMTQMSVTNSATSFGAVAGIVQCDKIDTTKYNFVDNPNPAGFNSVNNATTQFVSNVNSALIIQNDPTVSAAWPYKIVPSDIEIDYGYSGSAFANDAAQRDYDCNNAGITWVSDPNTHPAGINNVNLFRVRINKALPPDQNVLTFAPVRAKANLAQGEMLKNYMSLKNSTTNYGGATAGNWAHAYRFQNANNSCDLNTMAQHHNFINVTTTYTCVLADRAFIVGPQPFIAISDTVNFPAGLAQPLTNRFTSSYLDNLGGNLQSVSPGQAKTFNMIAGMSWMMDLALSNVRIYTVLPPGVEYTSASIPPSQVIANCNANINIGCVTDPALRTNYGSTSLVWERGDINYTYNGTGGAPDDDFALFTGGGTNQISINTHMATWIPNGYNPVIRSFVQTDTPSVTQKALPIADPTNFGLNQYEFTNDSADWDAVKVTTSAQFAIEKYGDGSTYIDLDGELNYSLLYSNQSGIAKSMDAIDILPYNGDGRIPASNYDGTLSLKSIDLSTASTITQTYVSSAPSASIAQDPNSNPAAGTGIWSCTYAQIGTPGCPSLSQVTAIRFISSSVPVATYGFIGLKLQSANNDGAEVYTNKFMARASTLANPVVSSDVPYLTKCLAIGDRVFFDENKNGKYDSGTDQNLADVTVELVNTGSDNIAGNGDDLLVQTATTDTNGIYNFSCIRPDNYYVRIQNAEHLSGGTLEGYGPAPSAENDPSNNVDEDSDHNLIDSSGTWRTNAFDIDFGSNPTGETGTHGSIDDENDNLTIDLALQKYHDVEVEKLVDGNLDGTFAKTEFIQTPGILGHPDPTPFQYKITASVPSWALASDGVELTDIVPPGVTIDSVASISQGSVTTSLPFTGAALIGSNLIWDLGTLLPGTTYTLVLNAELKSTDISTFSTGFHDGISTNYVQETDVVQDDVDSIKNNMSFPFNALNAEDDESIAGITIPPLLGNFVFDDANANGIQDAGENGIANVKAILFADDDGTPGPSSGDTKIYEQLTAIDGSYMFGSLNVGTSYYIKFDSATFPDHYTITKSDQGGDDTLDSDADPTTLTTGLYTLTAGLIDLSVDLGLHKKLSLGNKVFNDQNNNGVYDNGETGIAGVNVELFYANDLFRLATVAIDTTDSNGLYHFDDLLEGEYVVVIPDIKNDTNIGYRSSTGNTSGLIGSSGTYEPGANADSNTDDNDDGSNIGTTIIVESSTITLAYNDEPTSDGDNDSYTNFTLDFGFVVPFQIGNEIFVDKDDDGRKDAGENPYNQALNLTLYNSDLSLYDSDVNTPGVQSYSVNSDSNGKYLFENLPSGNYIVELTIPSNYRSSRDSSDASNMSNGINNIDRGFGVSNGAVRSNTITLGPSANAPLGDEDAPISDLFMSDSQSLQIADFSIVEANDLKLSKTLVTSGPYFATQEVSFDLTVENVGAGPSLADVHITDQLPVGMTYVSSTSDVPGDWTCNASGQIITCDRDANSSSIKHSDTTTISITASIDYNQAAVTLMNQAYVSPSLSDPLVEENPLGTNNSGYENGDNSTDSNNDSSATLDVDEYEIGDLVFFDKDNNGTYDSSSDVKWPNITLQAINPGPDGDYDTTGDNITFDTTTDANGNYLFEHLPYGQWRTQVTSSMNGYTQTFDGDSSLDSQHIVSFSDPNTHSYLDHDYGYSGNATLGDYVWEDNNGDKIQDPDEDGIENVSMTLVWYGFDGISGNDDDASYTLDTDANGNYLFEHLPVGNFKVTYESQDIQPLKLTTANRNFETELDANEIMLDADFGFSQPGVIGDVIFFDKNQNGILDQNEPGIPDIKVDLYKDTNLNGIIDAADELIDSQYTNESGKYEFTDLDTDDENYSGGADAQARYIVKVSGVKPGSKTEQFFASLINILGNPGQDNNGQNAEGTSVNISPSGRSNYKGDFAFYSATYDEYITPTTTTTTTTILKNDVKSAKGKLSETGANIPIGIIVTLLISGIAVAFSTRRRKSQAK